MARRAEIWGTFAQKVSDQFCQSIFSEHNLAFLAYYFEATAKSNCVRFTNCGRWEMWENVGKGGKVWDRLPSKPYEQVWKSIIINRKLPFSAHYFEVTIKSISTRSTNGGLWRIRGNVARCGEIWWTFAQNVSDQFCQSIFNKDNLAILTYYFEETTKSNYMRFTNCGCWEISENVGEDGKVWGSHAKQTIWAGLKVNIHQP